MKIRNFPTYWYQRKIFKLPDEIDEGLMKNKPKFRPKTGKVDPGPTNESD